MSPKRFLIINPYGIGDVLFTVPMIKNIRASVPDAFIGYVANRRTAPLLQNLDFVNHVTIYDRDEFKAVSDRSKSDYLKLLIQKRSEIRGLRYDMSFDLSTTRFSSFFCLLAGIKERVGLNYRNRGGFLTTKLSIRGYEGRHVAEYYLDLLRETGFSVTPQSMEVDVVPDQKLWAEKFLTKTSFSAGKFIIVFPGGGESWGRDAKFKRWPAVNYAELINALGKHFNIGVMLMGSCKEESLCKEIQNLVKWPLFNACGMTDLLQTIAILKASPLAVVNDGGPLHMAVAAGTRTVSVFGPVDDAVYGPYSTGEHRVITSTVSCRPCYRQFRRASCEHISCIKNIETETVLSAIKELLTLNDIWKGPLYGSPIC